MGTVRSIRALRLWQAADRTDEPLPGVGKRSGRWLSSRATPGRACRALMLRSVCWEIGPWRFGTGRACIKQSPSGYSVHRLTEQDGTDMSTTDRAKGKITEAPRSLAGDDELRSGEAAMTESPLFTRDPDHAAFKTALREMWERLDQLSDNVATLSAQVQDLAAEIRRYTSS